jgi:YYY domain-containing protein
MAAHILIWWLVVQGIGLLSIPATTYLLRTLPDRGYAFSKSLGLLLIGYGSWLLAMLGLATFTFPLLVLIAMLIGGGWLLAWRRMQQTEEQSLRSVVREYVQTHWRTILLYEILFLLALIAMAWLRSTNPAPWDSERPMDFAFFNAIQRSRTFPPHDPWLAGYSLNYYYFGFLMMAVVTMLSGLDAVVAYNLSLALIFALTALHIAGILINLIAITLRQPHAEQPPQKPARHVWRTFVNGFVVLLGVLMVLVVGNQAGMLQVVVGNPRVVALNGSELLTALAQSWSGAEQIELEQPVTTRNFGTFESFEREDQVNNFNPWWPSRLVWDERVVEDRRIASITEFPFFSFWLGDMHPHVMALPFDLLALAVALATLMRSQILTLHRQQRNWLDLGLAALVLGSLYFINSWDMPTYFALYLGALLLLLLRLHAQPALHQWMQSAAYVAVLVILMIGLFAPFHLTFVSFAGGDEPLTDIPFLATLSKIVAPYKDYLSTRVGLHTFVIIFGMFAIPLFAFVYMSSSKSKYQDVLCGWWLLLLGPLLLLIGWFAAFPLLGLVGVALFAVFRALRNVQSPVEAFLLLIVALGCMLCVVPDLVYIRDTFFYRLNTIFKFYYQVWLLWGTTAAYALWWLLTRYSKQNNAVIGSDAATSDDGAELHRRTATPPHHRIAIPIIVVLFAVFLAGGLVYPLVSLRGIVNGGPLINGPLSGLATKDFPRGNGLKAPGSPREQTEAGKEALDWLRQHASPHSVLLETTEQPDFHGNTSLTGYAGVATATGIPTVLGWYGHERLWRSGQERVLEELDTRRADVEQIYRTTDVQEAEDLLQKYAVNYIYVGSLERDLYDRESLAKFAAIAQPVFENNEVVIYGR